MIFHDWVSTELISGLSPIAWHQYQYGGSDNHIIYDSSGNERTLVGDPADAPVLTTNVVGNQPAWYFDGTKDPLVFTGSVTIKHAFVLASNDDATFDGYQGLLTGPTSGDVLVGDDATTKFFNLGIGNDYTKEAVDYVESNQQAPMGGFQLLEVKNTTGITLDGIQVGQQKADGTRLWKGYFAEMILFDYALTRDEIRRVRLYFNLKFGEWRRGLPFYFPSADLTMIHDVDRPSRFYDAPEDFAQITDDWEYEDGVKDFNEVADDAPLRWEYAYPHVPKLQKVIFDEFWNQARLVNSFLFKDPDSNVWTNVRIEDYNRNHDAHKRWRHDVAYRLVGYNSVGTYEAPEVIDEDAPSIPEGLTATAQSDTEILLEWDAAVDPAPSDTTPPSVPGGLSLTSTFPGIAEAGWTASTD